MSERESKRKYRFNSKLIQAARRKGYDLPALVDSSDRLIELLKEVLTSDIESSIVESDQIACSLTPEGYATRQAGLAGKRVGLRAALALMEFCPVQSDLVKDINVSNGSV